MPAAPIPGLEEAIKNTERRIDLDSEFLSSMGSVDDIETIIEAAKREVQRNV